MTIWNIDDSPSGGSVASPDEDADDLSFVTAFILTLLDDATSAEARATLDVPNTAELSSSTAAAAAALAAHVAALAASSGSSLAGFIQSGTGPTARTLQDKGRDIVASADHASLVNSIGAAGQAGAVYVPLDKDLGAARATNADGAYFWGPGKLKYTVSAALGVRVQNPAGRDRLAWGSEYLFRWIHKVSNRTAATVRVSGDSTAANLGSALIPMLAAFPSITLTTVSNSGEHTGQWVSTRLAADITAAPDLLIWHWGMNDCAGLSRTLAQFETDLRAGLTTYRASVPIGTGGILLMTPNAASDGTNGRDEALFEKMRQIIRCAAEDFQCAFFDTYGLFQDGYVGIGGTYDWLDDTGSGRGVHPQPEFARAIAGEVLNVIIPVGVQKYFAAQGVSNLGSADHGPLETDLPAVYPRGISIRRATPANSWPLDGFVLTVHPNDGTSPLQIHWGYNGAYSGSYIRNYGQTAATWRPWTANVAPYPIETPPTKAAAMSTYPNGLSVGRATPANGWDLDGYVITCREPTQGLYGYQELWQYNADVPTLRRQWTAAVAWTVWRQLGGVSPTTQTGATYTVGVTDTTVIANGSATLTLTFPAASSWTGRRVRVLNYVAFTVVSASSNVVPITGGAAGTAILAATGGKWADLESNGTSWVITGAN